MQDGGAEWELPLQWVWGTKDRWNMTLLWQDAPWEQRSVTVLFSLVTDVGHACRAQGHV